MRSLFVSIMTVMLAVAPHNASACCLFPMFPTYTAGYGGWGMPAWGYGGGYAGYGGGGYHTAAYPNYSYNNAGACCQPSPCCSPCSSGTCPGGSCAGDAVSSGKPVPDRGLDLDEKERERSRRRDRMDRTFDPSDNEDTRRRSDGYDPIDSQPDDQFSRPSSRDGAPGDDDDWRQRNLKSDRRPRLNDPERDGFSLGDDSTDSPDGDFGSFDEKLNLNERRENRKPLSAEDSNEPDFDPDSTTDRETRKPVIEVEDARRTNEEADSSSAPDRRKSDLGEETSAKDFLSPENTKPEASNRRSLLSQRESRSSHFDVRSSRRLAGATREKAARSTTLVSSSKSEASNYRWISLPAPAGQSRL